MTRRTPVLPSVAFAAMVILAGCSQSVEKRLAQGQALLKQGKAADAVLEFKKVIQQQPSSAAAHYGLGQASARSGDIAAAFAAYDQAVRLDPKHLDAKQRLAELYVASLAANPRARAEVHAKVDSLLSGLDQDPARRVDVLRLRATTAMSAGRHAAALALLEAAPAKDALPADLGLIRLQALLLAGRHEDAGAEARTLMDRHPGYSPIYSVYASHLISAGRLSDAEGVLRRQVEKNPNGVAAHVALANFLQRAGRGAEADRLASEWEARQPAPSGFLLAAGDHWLRRGDVPRAQAAYRRGLALGGEGKPAFFARLCDLELVRRDPEAALRAAQEGLKEFPSDFELRRKLSLMLLVSTDAKKREEARAGLVALLAEKPKEVALRLRLAASLEAEGKNAEAMEQLRQAVNQQPGSVEAQVALGSALLRGGQPALALERAEASLLLVPNLVAGLDLKTGALSDLRRYSELRVTLNEMRRITPDSPILAREFGWLALREGKLADAERELRRARSEDPADGRTLLGLVRVLVAQKRMPAALEEISRARAKEPARPDYRLLEGEVLLAMGKTKESRALFAGLVGDFPRFAEPRVQLSHIAWSEGDTGLSLKLLAEAKSLDGGDPGILRVYGNRLDALGRFTESVAVYRDAMKLEPANPIVWNNLAYALAASGQSLDEAEQLARKSVGVIQGQPGVLDTLGFVLLQRGQTAEAVKLFSGLAARHGANPVYRYHYGLALKKSGDAAAARRQFTQALALSPAPALERELQQALAPAAS